MVKGNKLFLGILSTKTKLPSPSPNNFVSESNRTKVEELTEEQQIELAMQMSLMDSDPYHHSNYTTNDDLITSFKDHAYAENYDIGPDVKNNKNMTMEENDVVKTSLRNKTGSFKVSGIDSDHVTTETDDIIKTCSKAVMSSDDQPISPGVLSDSESEVIELFHESDGSQKLTKIEDRNRNNNSANQEIHTSKYFSKEKAEIFENGNHEVDRNSEEKLPGGGKNNLDKSIWNDGQSEEQLTGSSDTDDLDLVIETETEYKKNTNRWFDNSFKSYSKSENRTWNNVVKEAKKCSGKSGLDLEPFEGKSSKRFKRESKDNENEVPNGETSTYSEDKSETEGDNLEIYLNSEDYLNEGNDENPTQGEGVKKTPAKNSNVKEERTPSRHRFGQKLEDIGQKMDDNGKAKSDHVQNDTPVKNEYRDKSLEEMHERLVSGNSKKEKEKKTTVDKDVYDFQCNEDGKKL